RFAVRERATGELEELGVLAEPALRRRLTGKPSLELRRRVDKLLERLARVGPPGGERVPRGAGGLGGGAPPAPRELLTELARQTRAGGLRAEARKSLERLAGQAKAGRGS